MRVSRVYELAAVLLFVVAIAPLILGTLGFHNAGRSGCRIDTGSPLPLAFCEDATEQSNIQCLVEYGSYFPVTMTLAGFPAAVFGALAALQGIRYLLRQRFLNRDTRHLGESQ